MKSLIKRLNHRKHLVFIDLEGTQFSHEMIALGAIRVKINEHGHIKHKSKGIKLYVKTKSSIGSLVRKMTGITEDLLEQKGCSFATALLKFKNYCGRTFSKSVFITFGSHDIRIINKTLGANLDADEKIVKQIVKSHIDLASIISMFVKDDKQNSLSLYNYLLTFNLTPTGVHHDPLDDAVNLMNLYEALFKEKDVLFNNYLKVLANCKQCDPPVSFVIKQLLEDKEVTPQQFKDAIRKYIG
jgi:inhibitor of KinA sporulation pathway (predicted exonuclease)